MVLASVASSGVADWLFGLSMEEAILVVVALLILGVIAAVFMGRPGR